MIKFACKAKATRQGYNSTISIIGHMRTLNTIMNRSKTNTTSKQNIATGEMSQDITPLPIPLHLFLCVEDGKIPTEKVKVQVKISHFFVTHLCFHFLDAIASPSTYPC